MNSVAFLIFLLSFSLIACNNDITTDTECSLQIQNEHTFIEEAICECPEGYIKSGNYCLQYSLPALYKTIKSNCPCDLEDVTAELKFAEDSLETQFFLYSEWIQIFDLIHFKEKTVHSFRSGQPQYFTCSTNTDKICLRGRASIGLDTLWMSFDHAAYYNCTDSNFCEMIFKIKI